ncbi:MAG: hypothetical protein AAFQ45_03465 [Pseudomonadota bacterium]
MAEEAEKTELATTELDDAQKRARRMRNIAIGLSLAGLVVIFYVATLVRLGANALNKPY